MTFLTYLYVAGAVVLLFGAAIFVHEFGHYWVARRRGMKVEEFAIGFGPPIVSWTKDGIQYAWRWIPAGGYVKLPQMITSEALEGKGDAKVPPADPLSKILVAFAGPLMNVVFAFAIATFIWMVGLPVPVNPPIIGDVIPDSAESQQGIHAGDKIVAVNGKPVKTWHDVTITAALARTNMLAVDIERDGVVKTYSLEAKADDSLGLKSLNLDSVDHPVIGGLRSGWPAEQAGLQPKDRFLSFAGVRIFGHDQLIDVVNKRTGQSSEVVVERDGKEVKLTVTPRFDSVAKKGYIGVSFAPTPLRYEVKHPGPTPWAQIADVFEKTFDTLGALFHSRETGVGIKDLSGPPGILAMLASQVKTDYRLALSFLVLLNVNLAILNLLPVPVLDGGHIVIAIIEKISRRPMPVRLLEYTTTAFAVLLISLMLYVSFNDVTKRFSLFKSMMQRDVQIEPAEKSTGAPALAK